MAATKSPVKSRVSHGEKRVKKVVTKKSAVGKSALKKFVPKKGARKAAAKKSAAVDATAVRAGRFLPKRRRNVPATARRPARERIGPILELLDEAYPVAECALNHENPLQLLVATILSAQCTDERVNIVTRDLFRRYRTAHDFAKADPAELEQAIRPTGFFRNKTKSLIGMGKALVERHGGQVPRTMEELLEVPGAARKTSNVVLGTAYGIAVGVVVDTHVSRVSQRLGLTRHEDPVRIEADLMKLLPQDRWIRYSHQIIHHGRQVCAARKPLCDICPLNELCPSAEISVGEAEDV
jgi:endonuclease-3